MPGRMCIFTHSHSSSQSLAGMSFTQSCSLGMPFICPWRENFCFQIFLPAEWIYLSRQKDGGRALPTSTTRRARSHSDQPGACDRHQSQKGWCWWARDWQRLPAVVGIGAIVVMLVAWVGHRSATAPMSAVVGIGAMVSELGCWRQGLVGAASAPAVCTSAAASMLSELQHQSRRWCWWVWG